MKCPPLEPNASEIEALLAVERDVPTEPQDFRHRAIQRARASLQGHVAVPFDVLSPGPRPLRIGLAAAAVVMLSGLCAAAFFAGYRTRGGSDQAIAREGAVAPSVASSRVAAPSVIVALVPVPTSPFPLAPSSDPMVRSSHAVPNKPTGSVTSATKSEVYAVELRILQPAQQAVALHDFASALATIAEHQRLYPSGILAEEREGLRVKALVGLGRVDEAQRAGAAFRKHFPRSALLGRIAEMLGAAQRPP
jgi:hypothetical protein